MLAFLNRPPRDPADHSRLLIATAGFALLWAVARACVQTITGDESDTFIFFVNRPDPFHWFSAANNHVLNSMLMRLFTKVFGLSHLTVRLPALLGATLYISAAYTLVRLLSRDYWLRWASFVCLVYNPFVFDFFVAARGYGMAAGLLLWAVTLAAAARLGEPDPRISLRAAIGISICLALSAAASFAFTFAVAFTWLTLFLWLLRSEPERELPPRFGLRLFAALLIPGLLVGLVLVGSVLRNWSARYITDGGSTVAEMLGSILSGSLYKLNPEFVNPWLLGKTLWLELALPLALLALVIVRIVSLRFDRSSPGDQHRKEVARLGAIAAAIVILTITAHAAAFSLFHLLMPRGRTALYLIPLATLIAVTLASLPAASHLAALARVGLKVTLFALAFYFLGCMRLSYFREWEWGADIRKVYPVIAHYNQTYCADAQAYWLYSGSLNFYTVFSGRESFKIFGGVMFDKDFALDKPVYVLHTAFNGRFIDEQKLKIVYHGESTDVVVAIREEALSGPPRPCLVRTF